METSAHNIQITRSDVVYNLEIIHYKSEGNEWKLDLPPPNSHKGFLNFDIISQCLSQAWNTDWVFFEYDYEFSQAVDTVLVGNILKK